jgi:lactoylglutathione lyase
MQLKKIDHITINILDLAKSLEFYEGVFELRKLSSVDMGDHVLHYFELPGGCKLELIEYRFETRASQAKETDRGLYRHIAFCVESVDEMKRRCDKYGVQIKSLPTYIEKLKFKNMLIKDPNGVEIELVERVS